MQLHGHKKRGRPSTTFIDTLKRNLEVGSKFELESCMLKREDWQPGVLIDSTEDEMMLMMIMMKIMVVLMLMMMVVVVMMMVMVVIFAINLPHWQT